MEVKKCIIPLWQRIVATIIDKVIILLFFIIFSFVLMPYTMPGKLGTFVGLANVQYNQINSNKTIYELNMDNESVLRELGYDVPHFDHLSYEYEMSQLDVYLEVIIIFAIFNLLYYVLCELFLKASLGKVAFNCRICKKDGKDVNWLDVLKRAGVMAVLFVAAVGLQIGFNGSIYVSCFLFFVLLDFMVFSKQQSSVDWSTDTYVVKKYAEYFTNNTNL